MPTPLKVVTSKVKDSDILKANMSGIRDQRNIEALRKRLYERTIAPEQSERHSLSEIPVDVSRGWNGVKPLPTIPSPVSANVTSAAIVSEEEIETDEVLPKKKRPYRMIIVLASIGFFIVAALVSSTYLFFGNNQISGKNISLSINAPFSVTAGEKLPLQVSVSNQNTIQIESATLILNYPAGTKSDDEQARDIYENRIPIDVLAAGEAINIPVSVVLYGEENEEKEIKAAIEYRVEGSNGTFFKDAESVKVKINSSPLVMRVNSIEKVSSGQEVEIKLTIQSNASVSQKNILVSAAYPNSFSFLKSDPEPSYGKNEWLIDEIKPESSKVITLRGRVSGLADEMSELQFSAGAPKSDNQFIMGSVLTKAKTSYTIEKPFISVVVNINNDTDNSVVIDSEKEAYVNVIVTNTLKEAIYDMRVEIAPKGNLIRDNLLSISGGLYDSNSKTINYEVSGMSSLAKVLPGETREFSFVVRPDAKQSTGSFNISTNVFARRVSEGNAVEELVGTALAEAKFSSNISLGAQVGYNDGIFSDSGPVPPVAGKATTYTVTFVAEANANDVSNTVLTATLPQYIEWLNKYDGEGVVEYNPTSKQLRWSIGNLDAKTKKQLQIQVSLLPSVTQVGRTIDIINMQELRATDRFTGAELQTQHNSLISELSEEAGFPRRNGEVQPAQ